MAFFPLFVGLRYTGLRSGNHLLLFLSRIATAGLVLAVALLIVVLSVMNGFDRELRLRILAMVPHLTLYYDETEGKLDEAQWLALPQQLAKHPEVLQVTPFVEREALLKSSQGVEPLMLYGMEHYDALATYLPADAWQRWQQNPRGLFLSEMLARRLGLGVGDEVLAVFPGASAENGQAALQLEVFQVAGLFNTHTELDKGFAWVHQGALQEIARTGHPQGFRIAIRDLFRSRDVGWELIRQLPPGFYGQDWSRSHGNLYEAVQMSRAMVSALMFIIIAVAVFNVISTLMLVVMEKKQAIAILQVMGARRSQVVAVFVIQGVMIGLTGALIGALLGSVIAVVLPHVLSVLEQMFHFQLINAEIYPVSYIPSDWRFTQVLVVVAVAILFSLLASFYPAWRASHGDAAQVLRYE